MTPFHNFLNLQSFNNKKYYILTRSTPTLHGDAYVMGMHASNMLSNYQQCNILMGLEGHF